MEFRKIDRENWARKESFDHYFRDIPCTYSITVQLDITKLRKEKRKLFPELLYCLAAAVNRHEEFRTAVNGSGELGVYSEMHPCYTVFHKDTETFSNLWTPYTPDRTAFRTAFEKDMKTYGDNHGMFGKPDTPPNSFTVSVLPWASFEGFNLNLQKGYTYLIPIFTFGKFYEENHRTVIPLAVQVHHAVCDGFHLCRFLSEVQELLDE